MSQTDKKQGIFESCLSGNIAQRVGILCRALSVRLLMKPEKQELLDFAQAVETSGFVSFNNGSTINIPDKINGNNKRLTVGFVFDKVGHLSRVGMVRIQFYAHRIKYDVRSMPVILNNIHLQYRHGGDRTDTTLNYGDDPYMRTLFLAMLMGEAAASIPDMSRSGAYIPLNDGMVLGRIEKPRQGEFADSYLMLDAARNPNGREHYYRKTQPSIRPTRMAIIHTFIGISQMDARQRRLHDAVRGLMNEREANFLMETYFANYIGGSRGLQKEDAIDKDPVLRAKTAQKLGIQRTKRVSGQTLPSSAPELDSTSPLKMTSPEAMQRIADIRHKLFGLMSKDDWTTEARITLSKHRDHNHDPK